VKICAICGIKKELVNGSVVGKQLTIKNFPTTPEVTTNITSFPDQSHIPLLFNHLISHEHE